MRFDLPANLSKIHELRFPVRWGDMDIVGHVNNATYFTYLETARMSWFLEIGCIPEPDGSGPVMINAFCNFINELTYPCDIVAHQYLGAIGRSSFDVYATLERADNPGVICATGGSRIVWSDRRLRKATPLPVFLRDTLEKSKIQPANVTGA